VQEIDVEALNVSNQRSNISFTAATLIFLSMINKSYVLSSKQSYGNPTLIFIFRG
jgi:hypothetical protein